MRIGTCFFLATLLLGGVLLTQRGQTSGGPKDALDKDYAAELPRVAPKEPRDALKTFQLPPGFRLELVAAEPLIRSPVAVDFDEHGRMFVVEFPEYNLHNDPNFKQRGCVKMLEDTDGDGVYDKATVYVDNLPSPVAVACWDGGIFVGAVPDLLFCKDTDGDGKADIRKAIYTGFAKDKAGEAMLNSFRWGLDNRFHISTSMAGGSLTPPDNVKAAPVSVRGQGMLLDPRTNVFELVAGTGQHGMSMDNWGRKFVCDNSNPIHMLMADGRYLTRNPYLQPPAPTKDIAPNAREKLFRVSTAEPWRLVRTRLRMQKIVPGPTEGGAPAGYFTGATGVTVYRGDAYPPEFQNNAFVGEVSNNLVYRAKLEPDGVGLVAKRADTGREFLASTDNWFRPAQFANAPDGTLHVIDMYRELIETVESIPPLILKHLHPESGIDRGRIYRIVPDGFKQRPLPNLGKASVLELVALLEHPNGWHRDTASRLLYQRQDQAAIPSLTKLAATSKAPLGRLHAAYALDGLKALEAKHVLTLLGDPEARVREHALKLAERFQGDVAVRSAIHQRLADDDLRVRCQLAYTLGAVEGESRVPSLLKLAQRDGDEVWVRTAILSSIPDRMGDAFRVFANDDVLRAKESGRQLLLALAVQIGAANRSADLATLLVTLDRLPASEAKLSQSLMTSLLTKLPASSRDKIQSAGKSGTLFKEMVDSALKSAVNDKLAVADRVAAIRNLGLADFSQARPLLVTCLEFKQPEAVQKAALETLSRFDQAGVPAVVLDVWPSLSPQIRVSAAETLFSRPAWVGAFLDAVERGKVKTSEIDPARVQLLQGFADKSLRDRAANLFASAKLSKRQDVVNAYQKSLQLKGDATNGRMVFQKNCAACHRLDNLGETVGAELSSIRDKGSEAVLLSVLDPNREVLPKFLSYHVELDSGRVLTGIITAETATSITLRRVDGVSESLLRVNIGSLRSTGMSFMPEGLEQQISHQQMADLLAFIMAAK